jgi:hypothetical protein
MRKTQEWLYRPRDVDLPFRAGLRPQIFDWSVGWLVQPAFVVHYRRNTHRLTTHQRGITSFYWMATLSSMDRSLESSAEAIPLATFGPQLDQPRAATIHSGPPASLIRTSKQYIYARGRPDKAPRASYLHSSQHPVLHYTIHGTSSAGLIQHYRGTYR